MARLVWLGATIGVGFLSGCGATADPPPSDGGPDGASAPDCCVQAPDAGDDAGRDAEAETDASQPPPVEPWTAPSCDQVTGSGSLTLSFDRGATLLPRDREPDDGFAYTHGLAALEEDGWLLAVSDDRLAVSQDAGCSWTELAVVGDLARVAAGPGRRGFVFGRQILLRVEGDEVTELAPPAEELVGLAVDPADGEHVRAVDDGCGLYESLDGGASWDVLAPAPDVVSAYEAAFDPIRLGVALCATPFDGALRWVEGDGWAPAAGLGEGLQAARLFQAAFSRVDPSIAWVFGNHDVAGQSQRALWLSRDGGQTFGAVVDETQVLHLNNNSFLAPDPLQSEVIWFRARSTVCRYDAAKGELEQRDNGREEIQALVRLPTEEEILAIGLRIEGPIE